ncbi:hypothetical protein VTL71DRAFT_14387 [Oculimacula yallundae]|uniref:Uncharacterized protein n=1 Tax=Oculimacula yallundae TaxID=86028 RepID=A0ABR4CIB0_9HELO
MNRGETNIGIISTSHATPSVYPQPIPSRHRAFLIRPHRVITTYLQLVTSPPDYARSLCHPATFFDPHLAPTDFTPSRQTVKRKTQKLRPNDESHWQNARFARPERIISDPKDPTSQCMKDTIDPTRRAAPNHLSTSRASVCRPFLRFLSSAISQKITCCCFCLCCIFA